MPKKKSRKNLYILLAAAIVGAAFLLLLLEKTSVLNLHESSNKAGDSTSLDGEKDVDYSPATTTDNEDINAQKADGSIEKSPNIPTNDTNIQVTFIANAQDYDGGPLEVRTLLNGVNDGSCSLTLSKGTTEIKKTSSVVRQNNYFVCEPFIIPHSELTNGNWKIILRVSSGDGRSNEASTTTEIK